MQIKYKKVSELLQDKHEREFYPGKKQECPVCNRKTLSISGTDTVAKCFHPSCNIAWSIWGEKGYQQYNKIQDVLLVMAGMWCAQLRTDKESDAYKYLTINRGIYWQVIQDSFYTGCVTDRWQHLIEAEIEDLKLDDADKNKEVISELEELKQKLKKALENKVGWLAFTYTDAYGNITQIKFRKPYSKIFTTFKLKEAQTGVYRPVTNNREYLDSEINKLNTVVEGEFNALSLQSLLRENGKNYADCVAVGGVSTADMSTVKKMFPEYVIAYDNDSAGKGLLETAAKIGSFEAFTTPEEGSDLDSFINSFESREEALQALLALFPERKKYFKSYDDIYNLIKKLRLNERKLKPFELNQEISKFIIAEIIDRAFFLYDINEYYLFLQDCNKLITLDIKDQELKSLLIQFGINPSESIFNHIFEELVHKCKSIGKFVHTYRYAYYDKNKFILYLYNGVNQVIKISRDIIEDVPNGTDDILFVHNDKFEPFDFVEIDDDVDLLDEYLFNKVNFSKNAILKPEEQKLLLKLYFYCMFFETTMTTKPLLAAIGGKGSGKTSILRFIGMLLFGKDFNVTSVPSKLEDLDTIVANTYFCVLDNVDSYIEGLNDKLACYSTGQTTRKRRHYSNNELYETTPRCYIAMSSRTPCFNRDDVADRIISLYFERIPKFLSDSQLTEELMDNRDYIMTYVVHKLQELINRLYDNRNIEYSTTLRMADFAVFALKTSIDADKTQKIFDKLIKAQSMFAIEEDTLVELLFRWLKYPENRGRKVSGTQLFTELQYIIENMKIKDFNYKSTKAVMKRINNIKDNIKEFVEVKKEVGRANQSFYTFNVTNQFIDHIDNEI